MRGNFNSSCQAETSQSPVDGTQMHDSPVMATFFRLPLVCHWGLSVFLVFWFFPSVCLRLTSGKSWANVLVRIWIIEFQKLHLPGQEPKHSNNWKMSD